MPLRVAWFIASCFAGSLAFSQSVDPGFNPGANNFVYALAAQADGRVLVGGAFTEIAGRSRAFLARLNADGSFDASFAPTLSQRVQAIAVQADGKILIAGLFTTVNGQGRIGLTRLNPDGSLDAAFINPNIRQATIANADVRCIVVQPDGKILVAGGFTSVGGQTRDELARLNPDGSLDLAFNPDVTGAISATATQAVLSVALQGDGKIVFAGQFTSVGGVTRNGLARVNSDGTLDSGFDPSPAPTSFSGVLVQPDGKIIVCGGFSRVGGQTQGRLARLNADGSADPNFTPAADGSVTAMYLQNDGSLLISGFFNTINGQPHVGFARLNRFGMRDPLFEFDLLSSPNRPLTPVSAVLAQADGSMIFGGDFSLVENIPRSNLARLTALAPSRLANLSTRGFIATGRDLTVGFGVRGGTKPLLLRAIGPSLGALGVSGALADPRLEAIPAGAVVPSATNDDWNADPALNAAFTATGAFGLSGTSKDSALLASVTNGTMTARVTSAAAGGSGVVLAEVYDRDPEATVARLSNLSTLGFVGTGTQVLIPGFSIQGRASKTLLIRAVGPSLAAFGVTDALPDPQIALVLQGPGTVFESNDNWGGDAAVAATFTATGAFPLAANSKDAVLVSRLPPGAYTVVVTGVGGTTGRVLVEVYDLDP